MPFLPTAPTCAMKSLSKLNLALDDLRDTGHAWGNTRLEDTLRDYETFSTELAEVTKNMEGSMGQSLVNPEIRRTAENLAATIVDLGGQIKVTIYAAARQRGSDAGVEFDFSARKRAATLFGSRRLAIQRDLISRRLAIQRDLISSAIKYQDAKLLKCAFLPLLKVLWLEDDCYVRTERRRLKRREKKILTPLKRKVGMKVDRCRAPGAGDYLWIPADLRDPQRLYALNRGPTSDSDSDSEGGEDIATAAQTLNTNVRNPPSTRQTETRACDVSALIQQTERRVDARATLEHERKLNTYPFPAPDQPVAGPSGVRRNTATPGCVRMDSVSTARATVGSSSSSAPPRMWVYSTSTARATIDSASPRSSFS
ncbi:hypothetical protein C8R47DRAFT_1258284 [Mycena vitilis]|nr:hypothetical protein C8R47DRAFT_1258284 [Mycena vitilis]